MMTSEEARLVLQVYRSGDDAELVRDALAQLDKDPELRAWFAEEQGFDRCVRRSLAEAPVPPQLKTLILQDAAPRRRWWRNAAANWGVAAVLLLSGILFTVFHSRPSRSVDDFRAAMVKDLWTDLGEHVEITSSDLDDVQEWLGSLGATSMLTLPPAVSDTRLRGARVIDWHNHKVASLCLLGHGKHLHLFVIPTAALASSPEGDLPAFEKCYGWKTVAWSHGENTYLLSGMSYVSFIKKSRHAGQWRFEG